MKAAKKLYTIEQNEATTSQPIPLEDHDETVCTSTKLEGKRSLKKKKVEGEFTPIRRRMDNIPDTINEVGESSPAKKKKKPGEEIREAVE